MCVENYVNISMWFFIHFQQKKLIVNFLTFIDQIELMEMTWVDM